MKYCIVKLPLHRSRLKKMSTYWSLNQHGPNFQPPWPLSPGQCAASNQLQSCSGTRHRKICSFPRVLRVLDELRIITVCPWQSFEFDNHLLNEAVTAQKDTILVEACKSTVLVCLPRCTANTSLSGSAMQVQKAEACLPGVFICCNECRCLGIWLY